MCRPKNRVRLRFGRVICLGLAKVLFITLRVLCSRKYLVNKLLRTLKDLHLSQADAASHNLAMKCQLHLISIKALVFMVMFHYQNRNIKYSITCFSFIISGSTCEISMSQTYPRLSVWITELFKVLDSIRSKLYLRI